MQIGKLVDVIIPTLSFDAYLDEAVASLIADGIPGSCVIVVLDGELKSLPSALETLGVRLVCTHRRQGTAAAINAGILASNKKYVGRLDADDISLPGRFESQLRELELHDDLVLLGGSGTLIDSGGNTVGEFAKADSSDLKRTLLLRNPYIHSSVVMRRTALGSSGLYNVRCERMQDYELFLRLAQVGDCRNLTAPLVGYRVHSGQNSLRIKRFWQVMGAISRARLDLARSLGCSLVLQSAHNLSFVGAQRLRFWGIRKPRYLRGIAR